LREKEAQNNNSFVFLSDVHLDSPRVMEKLQTVFTGFAGVSLPVAFVFMGDFLSEPMLPEGQSSNRYRGKIRIWMRHTDKKEAHRYNDRMLDTTHRFTTPISNLGQELSFYLCAGSQRSLELGHIAAARYTETLY
jgi:hypothetical protein